MGRVIAFRLAAAGAKLASTPISQSKFDSLEVDIVDKRGDCLSTAADPLGEHANGDVVDSVVAHYGRINLASLNVPGAPTTYMRTMYAADVKAYKRSHHEVSVSHSFLVLEPAEKQKGGFLAHTNSPAGIVGMLLSERVHAETNIKFEAQDEHETKFEYENTGSRTGVPSESDRANRDVQHEPCEARGEEIADPFIVERGKATPIRSGPKFDMDRANLPLRIDEAEKRDQPTE